MTRVPPPSRHGGDGAVIARALGIAPSKILDLSQSLNPVAPDFTTLLLEHVESLRRYPDPSPATRALAGSMGIAEECLLLTNGGAEAIDLVGRELGGRVCEPEFSLHPRSSRADAPLWRSNPHNPSGLLATAKQTADVWDEAFYPLATGSWTRGDATAVVVGSLTKLLGCPGLRVGYVVADVQLIDQLRACQPRWSVNALAASALPDLLEHVDLQLWSRATGELRADLVGVLRRHGLEPRPSDANWVLVDAFGLREILAPHAVVVRDCASFGMEGTMRVAVPSADGLARLDEALSLVRF